MTSENVFSSSAIRKIITETALRIPLAPVRMTAINKMWWEFKPVQKLQKSVSRFVKIKYKLQRGAGSLCCS